jgi:hypothetical protein
MQNDEKPIVFLSHSSLDKEPLAVLKEILDKRAAGFLNFFLSSDGESIKFGRNWVVSVSDALSQAKLMFVFLSPQSADSKWIHFEAGCAYAKDTRVVPVCLPGIDLNRITPPLGLLQGFNLHSHEAIGNIVRICNERFAVKIDESFKPDDFDNITRNIIGRGVGFFGDQTWAVDYISFQTTRPIPSADYDPLPILDEICKQAGMKGRLTKSVKEGLISSYFEQPGCEIKFNYQENSSARIQRYNKARAAGIPVEKAIPENFHLECKLSPELFHINAQLLDQWFEKAGIALPIYFAIHFRKQINAEQDRHRLTAKFYQCGINLTANGGFEFEGLKFNFRHYTPWTLEMELIGKLQDERLPKILERMFKSIVLWEHQPDLSEMFQGA